MNLRELLNAARWKTGTLEAWTVDVIHRGAPGNRRALPGARITKVAAAGVELLGDDKDSDTVFVPYHRFLEVRGSKSQRVWAKGESVDLAALALEAPPTEAAEETQAEVGDEVRSGIEVVLAREPMLVIDGSAGEGGGQILRSSLTLSMLTGTPFVIRNIRAGRKKPGLMRQHLTCVNAAAAACGAKTDGDTLRSTELVFRPGPVRPGEYDFAIGTAGSVCLVLQTIALPLALAEGASSVVLTGGTHNRWAPPYPFIARAWVPLLQRMGVAMSVALDDYGFYPAGGGKIVAELGRDGDAERRLGPIALDGPAGELDVTLDAIVANLPEGIARRELTAAAALLDGYRARLIAATVRSPGPGNAIWLEARGERVTNVFTALGERGVPAEDVGAEVASQFLHWRASETAVDEHLADQLMLPLAMAGSGSYTTGPLTDHSWTNIEVIAAFTERRIRVFDLGEQRFRLQLGD